MMTPFNDISNYIKTRDGGWTILLHKQFQSVGLISLIRQEPSDAAGNKLEKVRSSDAARVYRCSVETGGESVTLYIKEYLPRTGFDWIKHLFRPSRAERAFRAGLMLEQDGLNTPPIAAMLIKKKGPVVTENILITREMKQSHALYSCFEGAPPAAVISTQDKRRLFFSLGKTIGQMHAAGIFHGDLRGGNVFVSKKGDGWHFYFIDNERTLKYRHLPSRLRIKNLVQLNMLPKNITTTDRMRFLSAYTKTAGLTKNQCRRIAKAVTKKTLRRLKHRANTRTGISDTSLQIHWDFQRAHLGCRDGIFKIDFCKGGTAAEFLRQIDTLMETGKMLKNDTATCVVRCLYNNHDIVIKRYNYQGIWHSLRHTLKGSRARKCWRFGHRLMDAHIPCAAPLGLIEERTFGIIRQSYIINEFIEGPLLYDVMNRPGYSQQKRDAVMQKAEQLLEDMGRYRLTHADMKPANLIIHNRQPVLIDLDSMQQHRMGLYFRYRYKKMVTYFHCRLHGKKRKN